MFVRPECPPAPDPYRPHRRIRAFDGAAYNTGARFERVVSRFGGRIHGESVTFLLHDAGESYALRVDLRYQGPMAPVDVRGVMWDEAKGRVGPGAYDAVPRVAWSEGIRAMAAVYGERDVEGWGADRRDELPADSSAAYQVFLTECAAHAATTPAPSESAPPVPLRRTRACCPTARCCARP
ncbi:hypothetical protein ACF08N_21130 [Streptomyces sp. NPDC015127]|uniref:hypothetical protein n=1 Tax=Streptomyces sp. NPDC015127 TaxID=3364939 RepID=UPI0036FA9C58